MIIGNRHVSDAEVLKYGNNLKMLAQKSIPVCCSNSKKLLDNQLFFLVSRFRNQTTVPYSIQQRIVAAMSECIECITGTMGTIHDMEDILTAVDVNQVFGNLYGKQTTTLSENELHLAIEAMLNGGKV